MPEDGATLSLTSPPSGRSALTAWNQQIIVFGNARRPVTAGSMTLTIFPTSRLTVSNYTAISQHSHRRRRNLSASSMHNTLTFENLDFSSCIRTFTNATDANYRATKVFGFSPDTSTPTGKFVRSSKRAFFGGCRPRRI